MIQSIFNFIQALFNPLYLFLISITSIIALILGAVADPAGAVDTFICKIIDIVVFVLPSTPDNLKIANLLMAFATAYPIVGWGIVLQIIQNISTMFAIVVVIKIYKLIPFKMS